MHHNIKCKLTPAHSVAELLTYITRQLVRVEGYRLMQDKGLVVFVSAKDMKCVRSERYGSLFCTINIDIRSQMYEHEWLLTANRKTNSPQTRSAFDRVIRKQNVQHQ